MARYSELEEKDILQILQSYSITLKSFKPIDAGESNTSFMIIGEEGKFVLTIYESKSYEETLQLANILKHLEKNDYKTTLIESDIKGHVVTLFSNKPVIIKKWISGKNLREQDSDNYTEVGKAMARLHMIPVPDSIPQHHSYGINEMPGSLGHQFDLQYESWLREKIEYIKNVLPLNLPKCFIHGDLFDDNIIFDQGEFKAIIDFEDSCHFYRAFDLGSIIFGACIKNGKLDQDKVSQIIKGYTKIMPLSNEELEAIQFLTVYAGAAISAWRYIAYFKNHPDPSKHDRHRQAMSDTEHIQNISPLIFNKIIS